MTNMFDIGTDCGRLFKVSHELYSTTLELHEALYKGHPNACSVLWSEGQLEFEVVLRNKWVSFVASGFEDASTINEDAVMLLAVALYQADLGVRQ